MPPRTRKRALAEGDSDAQPPPSKATKGTAKGAAKGAAKGGNQSKKASDETENASASASASGNGGNEDNHDHNHDDLKNRPPYEYYCLQRPFHDYEKENEDKDEDEQLEEDELGEQYNAKLDSEDNLAGKPVANHPDYKWVSMWSSWTKYCDLKRLAFYTCPDAFGMYIYNDFNGYGLQELVQNTLINFDKEFSKKLHNDDRLNEMWSITSSFVHWLLQDELGPWVMMDDGDLFNDTVGMIELMFVTMLNELDLANLLKHNSRIKDLGLVMACYIQWSDAGESGSEFPQQIIAYAKKAGIDLGNVGLYGMKEKLEEYEKVEPLSGNAKADRWAWKKKFNAFKKSNGITYGEKFNILKMSRKERASYAFDKKDPLKSISDKDLREGNIMPE